MSSAQLRVEPRQGAVSPTFMERHYSPSEIAEFWGLSYDKILEIFREEPGVVILSNDGRKRRTYSTIRIPESVAQRVHRRLTRC